MKPSQDRHLETNNNKIIIIISNKKHFDTVLICHSVLQS